MGQTCCGLGKPESDASGRGGELTAPGNSAGKSAQSVPFVPVAQPASPELAGQAGAIYPAGREERAGHSERTTGGSASSGGSGGGGEAECFPVSRAERERILRAIGALPPERLLQCPAGRESLFKPHPNSPSFVESLNALFPRQKSRVAELYPAGGSHLRMNLTAEGNCALLAPDGCVLPQEARPWFCRIFPFWVMGRQLACFAPEDCLAVRENRTPGLLLRAFDTDKETIFQLYKNLRADWGLDEA